MIGVIIAEGGHLNTAVKWALTFHAYLRPGEGDRPLTRQLVPPASRTLPGVYQQWALLLHPAEDNRPGK
eukprot:8800742-Alexandrium_andersonii.AAC.1